MPTSSSRAVAFGAQRTSGVVDHRQIRLPVVDLSPARRNERAVRFGGYRLRGRLQGRPKAIATVAV